MNNDQIWLALSGGGFRAALFHYGCLKRLDELGVMEDVFGVSATSGGALVAALYADSRSQGQSFEEFETRLLSVASEGLIALPVVVFFALFAEALGFILYAMVLIIADWSWPLFLAPALVSFGVIFHVWAFTKILQIFRSTFHDVKADKSIIGTVWDNKSRIVRMMLSPARCRWEQFSLQLFQDRKHKYLDNTPQIHLAAVDLNQGEQFVFSNRYGARLDVMGCRHIWDQNCNSFGQSTVDIEEQPLGYSVAASSAFPPIFNPIPFKFSEDHVRVLWDGGLLDNHAVETVRALIYHTRPEHNHYNPEIPNHRTGFLERIDRVIIMDGSGAHTSYDKSSWWRLRGFMRIVAIFLNKQKNIAEESAWHIESSHNIPCSLIGLKAGLWSDCEIFDEDLSEQLASVRTHFDAFSTEEMAILVYAGYTWIEYLNDAKYKLLGEKAAQNAQMSPLKPFCEILPAAYRPYQKDPADLLRHMRASGSLIAWWRKWKRRQAHKAHPAR